MSTIDTRYIVAPDLQTLFNDKDTGTALSGGYVEFFRDDSRNTHKPVYKLTGTPGNYSFAALPNPLRLNAAGAYSSSGLTTPAADDIQVYFFPYLDDGITLDLYYVKVFSAENVEQFDRQAQPPNIGVGSTTGTEAENFIANGQFTLHLTPPGDPTSDPVIPTGRITQSVTDVAYGGWTFERPNTSTDEDSVIFIEDSSYFTEPPNNPRFRLQVENSLAGGDAFKDLRVKFLNVHRFSSDTQVYTFGFNGASETASDVQVTIMIYKFYGSGVGASPFSTSTVQNVILTPSETTFVVPIIFGDNTSKTVVGDDDYVQIVIRFPTSGDFQASFTDMLLYKNNVSDAIYPTTTTRQDVYRGIAGGAVIPDYTGMDLYLPLLLTPSGLDYDRARIGKIFASPLATAEVGELLCDGAQYPTDGFSSDGIPYLRLQQKLFNNTLNYPIFGTGAEYFLLYRSTTAFGLLFNNGSTGVVTATADGTPSTGFSFRTVHTAATTAWTTPATDYDISVGLGNIDSPTTSCVVSIGQFIGAVTEWADVNIGFTVTSITNNAADKATFLVETIAAAGITGGDYMTLSSINSASVLKDYYLWATVNGVGADPAPGGTGIEVQLETADTAAIVAQKVVNALQGVQSTYIGTVAAASMTAGANFIASSTSAGGEIGYYVWYKIAGVGTDPAVANRTGILVELTGTETADQVLVATQQAVNGKFFAVWDGQGKFIRGVDPTGKIEPLTSTRFTPWMIFGANIGTDQYSENLSHLHSVSGDVTFTSPPDGEGVFDFSGAANVGNTGGDPYTLVTLAATFTADTSLSGSFESRPYNSAFTWVMYY